MQKKQTAYLKYGAIIILLFTVLLAVALNIPFIGFITAFIVPLPIAWYSAKFERKHALLVIAVMLIISIISGSTVGFIFGIIMCSLGFIMGRTIQENKSKLYMLMALSIFLLLILAILYIISVLILNINVIEQFLKTVEIYYEQAGNIMSSVGQLPKDYDEMVTNVLLMVKTIMPSYFIGGVFVMAFIYLTTNLFLLKKLKIKVPKFSKFNNFRLPKVVLWYYLIVSVLTLFVSYEVGSFGYIAGANALLILRALIFLQGVSFIHYYFHVRKYPKWTAILATCLAVPLNTFTIILGVLDLGFNLRGFLKDRYKK